MARNKITMKQTKALKLWARDFTIKEIAQKMGVSYGTIKERISIIKKRFPEYYENAQGIRDTLKRSKHGIAHPLSLGEGDVQHDEDNKNIIFIKNVRRYRDESYDQEVK